MAKVKFGALASDARGKIDGVVYSKNQFGAYIRQKVSPMQPQTERQTLVRERQTTLSKRFSTVLTEVQREAWRQFALTNPVVDVFGDAQILTGIASYIRLNQVILNGGGTIIDLPPANLEVAGLFSMVGTAFAAGVEVTVDSGDLTSNVLTMVTSGHSFVVGQKVALSGFTGDGVPLNGNTVTITSVTATDIVASLVLADIIAIGTGTATSVDQIDLAFTPDPLAAGLSLYNFASQGFNAGVNFFKPALRFINVSTAAPTSPVDIAAPYTARFGALTAGRVIGVTAAVVDITRGARSPGIFSRVVVV